MASKLPFMACAAAHVLVLVAICSTPPAMGRTPGRRPLAAAKELMQYDIDLEKATRVLDEMLIPRTPQWDRFVRRVVVNRQNPLLPPSFPKAQFKTKEATQRLMYLYPKEDFLTNYTSCAVVGNAGMMLETEYGSDIDAHDVIIRLNDGPTGNWSQYVGSRTTVRILNNYWTKRYKWTQPENADEENLMLFSFAVLGSLAKIKERHFSKTREVVYMSPELAMNARRCYAKTYFLLKQRGIVKVYGRNAAPTGIEGVFMAMHMCKNTNIYGFDVIGTDGYPYHYFDAFKGTGTAHSFKYQSLFLRMLERRGKLNLCVPGHANEWCRLATCDSCNRRP